LFNKTKMSMTDNNRGIHDVFGTDGRLLFLGMETFVSRVVREGACFVCGQCSASGEVFNQEHIIPRWLMVHAGISSQRITLMNGESRTYGEYKIPVCANCNTELGAAYEERISAKLKLGYRVFREFFETEEGRCLTYRWLCLLLIKCMLKDCRFMQVPDRRVGLVSSIGDAYAWHRHHHLLCVARSAMSGAHIAPSSIGSLFVVKADGALPSAFDFGTVPAANAVRIQVGDIVIVGVLDDAGFAEAWFNDLGLIFPNLMTRQQVAELSLMAALASMKLTPRPVFGTKWFGESHSIEAEIPAKFMAPSYRKVREAVGPALYRFLLCEGLLVDLPISTHEHLAKGEMTFFPEVLGGKDWEGVRP